MTSKEGNSVIYARSYADVVYWLEVIPKPAKRHLSDVILQGKHSDEDLTESTIHHNTLAKAQNCEEEQGIF